MKEPSSKAFGELAGVERTAHSGLACVRVQTQAASGLVFLQGAHIAEWVPAARAPVIWMSEQAVYRAGTALRGGVPICFPWFGANATHAEFPAHGFARTTEFSYTGARLDDSGRPELELMLVDSEATQRFFPYAFEARLRVAFGAELEVSWLVQNRGSAPFTYEEALHSYFHVGDVRRASVLGLQGATYHDKVRGMAAFQENAPDLQLSGETDRVYDSAADCTIVDPVLKRSIQIQKANSHTTVIWNPWAERAAQMPDFGAASWPSMLCVECANVGAARVSLAPGEQHRLGLKVSLASLG